MALTADELGLKCAAAPGSLLEVWKRDSRREVRAAASRELRRRRRAARSERRS